MVNRSCLGIPGSVFLSQLGRTVSVFLLAGLFVISAKFSLANDPRPHESEYLLTPWYKGEALPGLIPTILPEGQGTPLILVAEVLYAINAEKRSAFVSA